MTWRRDGRAVRRWSCLACNARGEQIGRGALRTSCSNACRRALTKRRRAERNLAGAAARTTGGQHAALHPAEILEVVRRMADVPRGERRAAMDGLATDYGVSVRTLHRYLALSHVEQVVIGGYGCWFGLRRRRGRAEPVQLTGWEVVAA